MDFKWTLSRPGIELEFETGSIKEAIGLLEQEGSSITEVFGFNMGNRAGPEAATPLAAPEEPKTRKPRAPKEAVAPPPLAIPAAPAAPAAPSVVLPPNALNPAPAADDGIPAALKRDANNEAPALIAPLPSQLPSPPLAPLAPLPPSVPPVGVLGPKVVKALDEIQKGKDDGGQALSDWLAAAGLTQKGAKYDDACRAVLMISDEKLKGVAAALGVAA